MVLDAIVTAKLVEFGIIGLQGFFTAMELANKTPEEVDAMYVEEKTKAQAKKPELLKDV